MTRWENRVKNISLRNQLSYRLTKITIIIALTLGILLSIIQIFKDFSQERVNVENRVNQMLNMIKYSASQAAYSLDNTLAIKIIDGLFEEKSVVYAEIRDDIGESLGKRSKEIVEDDLSIIFDSFFQRIYDYEIKLYMEESYSKSYVGVLTVKVDKFIIFNSFSNRAISTLTSGIVKNLLLAMILIFVYRLMVTKPLFTLANSLSKINYEEKLNSKTFSEFSKKDDELNYIAQTIKETVNVNIDNLNKKEEAEKRKQGSLRDLLDNISHQWRQPLTVINLAANNIEDSIEYGDDIDKKDIKKIYEETKYLSETLNFFTSIYSKSEVRDEIEPQILIEKIVSLLKINNKDIRIDYKINIDKNLLITSNEFILHEVFLDVLTNSVENSIEKSSKELFLEIYCNKDSENSEIEFVFIDNAGGIPESILPTIFEPYTTTHHKDRSKGLGLYKVKNLIEFHLHGKIQISNLDDGVAVKIYIKDL